MGTIVIICLIVILGGLVYTYFKKDENEESTTGEDLYPPEYTQFLKNMETVFRGAKNKGAQQKFLKDQEQYINKWSKNLDFSKKYDRIIQKYRLW